MCLHELKLNIDLIGCLLLVIYSSMSHNGWCNV